MAVRRGSTIFNIPLGISLIFFCFEVGFYLDINGMQFFWDTTIVYAEFVEGRGGTNRGRFS